MSGEIKVNRLVIEEGNLHKEWRDQAELFQMAAKDLAELRFRLDQAESALEVAKAECARQIRNTPSAFGIPKSTEPAVKEAVILHPQYQKATRKVNRLKYEVAMQKADVDAYEHRKKALEKMVDLYLSGYWSEPREGRGKMSEKRKEEVRRKGVGRKNE